MREALRLALSPVADIRSITEPCADMLQAAVDGRDIIVDLSAVEEADLTLVQLILSARRGASASNQSLSLAGPAPEAVLRLLERGGFIGPPPDARRDFWLAI